MSNVIERFVRRLKRIGIDVQLSANAPWVYLDSVNNQVLMGELFRANHGFTAFWLPVREGRDIVFTDRRKVFAKVREYVMKDKEFNLLLDDMKPEVVAQARRFYHHVLHGGTLRPEDVAFMVEALEEAANEREWVGPIPLQSDRFSIDFATGNVSIGTPNQEHVEETAKGERDWAGLSYRDVMGIFEHWDFNRDSSLVEFNKLELCELFELVEAKLKEKNT